MKLEKVKVLREARTPRAMPSRVSVKLTVRFATDRAFARVGSTNSEKVTAVDCPPGRRPMFFGESSTRIAPAPGPLGVRVAVRSLRSSVRSKLFRAIE